jgi:hypothetical protein
MNTVDTARGVGFYSQTKRCEMRYLYPDSGHSWAGWILYRHAEGHWVALRKASDADIAEISAAVVSAHHSEAGV